MSLITHYSSMQLPLTNDVTRIGFLYPHNMFGFALPERHSGALPFQRRAICLVRQADLAGIENQIVRYRARVHMIGRSVFRDAFPLAGDDVYDHFRRQGFLYLLSIAEEDTFIEYYEQRMHEVIHGGHFIETHWEQPTVVRSSDFDNVLHKAIVAACEHVGAESPVREIMQSSQGKTGDRWLGQGFVIARPTIHPSINFQLHTDIASETAMNDEVRFNRMKEVIIDSINQHYGLGPGVKDINATHNYTASPHTILQSTAARQIRDPILSLVRNWLEKKKPD